MRIRFTESVVPRLGAGILGQAPELLLKNQMQAMEKAILNSNLLILLVFIA